MSMILLYSTISIIISFPFATACVVLLGYSYNGMGGLLVASNEESLVIFSLCGCGVNIQ